MHKGSSGPRHSDKDLRTLAGPQAAMFSSIFNGAWVMPIGYDPPLRSCCSAGRLRASMGACRSRTTADDRLPLASLVRVQGGDGVVEARDVADVRPQPSVTHPP